MQVADLMKQDLQMVSDDVTVAEAVITFAEGHIHGVPVVNRKKQMVGVLSTSDVLEAAAECADAAERNALFEKTMVVRS